MMVVIGCVVVLSAVVAGFSLAGGHVGALIHPSELLTIGGASLGALIMMSPKKIFKDLVRAVAASMKGPRFDRPMYEDLFKLAYDLMRLGRREGLLAMETHLADPAHSPIFSRYPRFLKERHALAFFCTGFSSLLDGSATPDQVSEMLDAELKVIETEQHAPINVLAKTADGLPGFGIVAAVLGIVITMGSIDGPVEEVGHKVGAALVGTFLGILMSYGFFGPLAARMEFLSEAELTFYKTMATIIICQAKDYGPRVAIERACRGTPSEARPNLDELDQLFREVETAA